jgi:hypothetical protein
VENWHWNVLWTSLQAEYVVVVVVVMMMTVMVMNTEQRSTFI